MSLLYDSYGVRRVAVEVNLWPDVEKFDTGALGGLFGALNSDDLFSLCDLRPETGAHFQGDAWTYDLSNSTVLMRCNNIENLDAVKRRMRLLLEGTRRSLDQQLAFYTDEIRVFCHVPEGAKRNVESVLQRRLLSRQTDRSDLPGLEGAGLNLTGLTESYHWDAEIEPFGGDAIMLTARLHFRPTPEPPSPGPDVDAIETQIGVATSFVTEHLLVFSSKFIK
jgi:hypothetical protein